MADRSRVTSLLMDDGEFISGLPYDFFPARQEERSPETGLIAQKRRTQTDILEEQEIENQKQGTFMEERASIEDIYHNEVVDLYAKNNDLLTDTNWKLDKLNTTLSDGPSVAVTKMPDTLNVKSSITSSPVDDAEDEPEDDNPLSRYAPGLVGADDTSLLNILKGGIKDTATEFAAPLTARIEDFKDSARTGLSETLESNIPTWMELATQAQPGEDGQYDTVTSLKRFLAAKTLRAHQNLLPDSVRAETAKEEEEKREERKRVAQEAREEESARVMEEGPTALMQSDDGKIVRDESDNNVIVEELRQIGSMVSDIAGAGNVQDTMRLRLLTAEQLEAGDLNLPETEVTKEKPVEAAPLDMGTELLQRERRDREFKRERQDEQQQFETEQWIEHKNILDEQTLLLTDIKENGIQANQHLAQIELLLEMGGPGMGFDPGMGRRGGGRYGRGGRAYPPDIENMPDGPERDRARREHNRQQDRRERREERNRRRDASRARNRGRGRLGRIIQGGKEIFYRGQDRLTDIGHRSSDAIRSGGQRASGAISRNAGRIIGGVGAAGAGYAGYQMLPDAVEAIEPPAPSTGQVRGPTQHPPATASRVMSAPTSNVVDNIPTGTVNRGAVRQVARRSILKSIAKKLPVIGLAAGAGFAIDRMMSGDFTGAMLEAGSGLASMIPGVGTALSFVADTALLAKDLMAAGLFPSIGDASQYLKDNPDIVEEAKAEAEKESQDTLDKTSEALHKDPESKVVDTPALEPKVTVEQQAPEMPDTPTLEAPTPDTSKGKLISPKEPAKGTVPERKKTPALVPAALAATVVQTPMPVQEKEIVLPETESDEPQASIVTEEVVAETVELPETKTVEVVVSAPSEPMLESPEQVDRSLLTKVGVKAPSMSVTDMLPNLGSKMAKMAPVPTPIPIPKFHEEKIREEDIKKATEHLKKVHEFDKVQITEVERKMAVDAMTDQIVEDARKEHKASVWTHEETKALAEFLSKRNAPGESIFPMLDVSGPISAKMPDNLAEMVGDAISPRVRPDSQVKVPDLEGNKIIQFPQMMVKQKTREIREKETAGGIDRTIREATESAVILHARGQNTKQIVTTLQDRYTDRVVEQALINIGQQPDSARMAVALGKAATEERPGTESFPTALLPNMPTRPVVAGGGGIEQIVHENVAAAIGSKLEQLMANMQKPQESAPQILSSSPRGTRMNNIELNNVPLDFNDSLGLVIFNGGMI